MDSYTRTEQYLSGILNGTDVPEPYTREEQLLYDIAKNGGGGGGGADKEDVSNKVTSLSAESTDTEYPSAKCVYDLVGNVETALADLIGGNS